MKSFLVKIHCAIKQQQNVDNKAMHVLNMDLKMRNNRLFVCLFVCLFVYLFELMLYVPVNS